MSTTTIISAIKKSNKSILIVNVVIFLFSIIEVYAEFTENNSLQYCSKPFILPALAVFYWLSTKKHSSLYLVALLFNWMANILFVSINFKLLLLASVLFLLHRILILIKIFKDEKELSFVPIALGSIPFLFLFLSLINLVYESIFGGQFYLILIQVVLMTLLGGYSLANFIIKNSISSKILMISSLFFGVNLFILGIKYYYIDFSFLKPISMVFFVLGHYTLCYFMISRERVDI